MEWLPLISLSPRVTFSVVILAANNSNLCLSPYNENRFFLVVWVYSFARSRRDFGTPAVNGLSIKLGTRKGQDPRTSITCPRSDE